MVKTTINLEDELYRELVNEAVEKYGTVRTLSKLINEKLRKAEGSKVRGKGKEQVRRRDIVKKTAGLWKTDETGAEYVRKLRRESDKRFTKLGIV